jgi:pyruvate/2-oxoglutarate dehydrogenase complex dihydrolipoamide dehydrogenase (E3) component
MKVAKKELLENSGYNFFFVPQDLEALMATKDTAVKQLTGGIKMLFKNNKVTHLEGTIFFVLPFRTRKYSFVYLAELSVPEKY